MEHSSGPTTPKRSLAAAFTTPDSTPSSMPGSTPDPKGSSSKRQKMPMMRKMTENGVKLKPGIREKTKTFTNRMWEREGQTAAYLNYTILSEFRKFAISPIVLKWFHKLGEDRTASRLHSVLELFRDCPDAMQSDEDPSIKYPRNHTGKTDFRVALIVSQAFRDIEKARTENRQFTAEDIRIQVAELEKATGCKFPCISPGEEIVYPKFGPFPHLGESDLEAYARVCTLLRYVGYSSNKAIWKSRYASKEWDAFKGIDDSHTPHWMRPKTAASEPSAPNAPTLPLMMDGSQKSALVLQIKWKYKCPLEEPAAYRSYIEEEAEHLKDLFPYSIQTVRIDPEASKEQFMDLVRSTFTMDKIRANIDTLQLSLVGSDEKGEVSNVNITTTKWSSVQEALWDSQWDMSKAVLSLTVRLADEGEIIWQSTV